jgi:2-oxoglutarate dehydrogenase E1 component
MGFALGDNRGHLDELYAAWRRDPQTVPADWAAFFSGMEFAQSEGVPAEGRVRDLIEAYRTYGHLAAAVNPLQEPSSAPQLSLEASGLTQADLDRSFPSEGILPQQQASLREIVAALQETYCGSIGMEYMGCQGPELEHFVQARIEPTRFRWELPLDVKRFLFSTLNEAELFEIFLQTRFVGAKRFSLEGLEALVPGLRILFDTAAGLGVHQSVLGMAHRGRLTVLHTLLGRPKELLFHEFGEAYLPYEYEGSGDVKYHRGYTGEVQGLKGQAVKVTILPNPSHLEAVDPVVEGCTRALQEASEQPAAILPVLVHGDASIAGQGVVYETLQMMRLRGYSTGGTIHLVANNQVGFTTSPSDGRSTRYCTDLAKGFGCPVLHVNADDVEALARAMQLAAELRQRFGCDIFVDLIGYRKYGHNEGDEPAFTQPVMVKQIRARDSARILYRDQLVKEGALQQAMVGELEQTFRDGLQQALSDSRNVPDNPVSCEYACGQPFAVAPQEPLRKRVPLHEVAQRLLQTPAHLQIHPKVKKLIEDRRQGLAKQVDWGWAETLAMGSLLLEGVPVRLSGQDVGRGTFSHRHALWVDQEKNTPFFALAHLGPDQAPFSCYNSHLSEYGVLGFEYGYSLGQPQALVIWEAQFGDFANGAQILIDQFIASAEVKWGSQSRLMLLLPHGFEGQGPEHSSARLERFLQLCAEQNMQVCVPSTSAQIFHLMRRQATLMPAKPLVVMSPKGLLRLPAAMSPWHELEHGSFQPILHDDQVTRPRRLVLCCGRIYYDLVLSRQSNGLQDVAIVRVEQLYPSPELEQLLQRYQPKEVVWAQDEPANQGAWSFVRALLPPQTQLAARPESASTATGSHADHKRQQETLLRQALIGSSQEK